MGIHLNPRIRKLSFFCIEKQKVFIANQTKSKLYKKQLLNDLITSIQTSPQAYLFWLLKKKLKRFNDSMFIYWNWFYFAKRKKNVSVIRIGNKTCNYTKNSMVITILIIWNANYIQLVFKLIFFSLSINYVRHRWFNA